MEDKLKTINDLADKLHLTPDFIKAKTKYPKYKSFKIQKRNGSKREICAPNFELKILQKWILLNVLERETLSESVMAFRKGKNGIKENAQFHMGSRYILEMDLKDFYPSITFYMVKNLFNKKFGYSDEISDVFAKLCTYKGVLPQGGITSPAISNHICKFLDNKLVDFCRLKGIKYSRYADDLTFSCDDFYTLKDARSKIEIIINKNSRFKLNEDKTRLLAPNGIQRVTGITINQNQLKVSKSLKNKIRAVIYFSIKTGILQTSSFKTNKKNKIKNAKEELIGNIAFINSIEPDYLEKIIKYILDLEQRFGSENGFELLSVLTKMLRKQKNMDL